MQKMKSVFTILIFILTTKVVLCSCAPDDNTLTEKLFKGQPGTIFICNILTSEHDENGKLYSRAEIKEVIFGSVDTNNVLINTGSQYSSVGGSLLSVGQDYIIYTSGNGKEFGCCGICDRWTKKLTNNKSTQSELETLRKFADIFNQKKSGNFDFFYSNGSLAATGEFTDGVASGKWRHFYENDTLKTVYDFQNHTIIQYSKKGFILSKSTSIDSIRISEQYSSTDKGLLEYKFIDTKNDTGSFSQTYEYFDNGNLKEIHGQVNINVKGGATSTGREGLYKEYYENGNLKLRGQFIKNRRVGVWIWYHENGEYNTEFDYKDGTGPQ